MVAGLTRLLVVAALSLASVFAAEGQSDRAKNHWAFKAPIRPAVPQAKDSAWCRTPIDHFILARLEKEGIKPSAQADKITLVRRLYLDLIGLPPRPSKSTPSSRIAVKKRLNI